jgi:hypothetical protein
MGTKLYSNLSHFSDVKICGNPRGNSRDVCDISE